VVPSCYIFFAADLSGSQPRLRVCLTRPPAGHSPPPDVAASPPHATPRPFHQTPRYTTPPRASPSYPTSHHSMPPPPCVALTPPPEQVFVCGLAFDFCVSFTAKDAARAGFKVVFLEDASRAITQAGKEAAVDAMTAMGIELRHSSTVPHKRDYEEARTLKALGL
jgi:hypothetical protein